MGPCLSSQVQVLGILGSIAPPLAPCVIYSDTSEEFGSIKVVTVKSLSGDGRIVGVCDHSDIHLAGSSSSKYSSICNSSACCRFCGTWSCCSDSSGRNFEMVEDDMDFQSLFDLTDPCFLGLSYQIYATMALCFAQSALHIDLNIDLRGTEDNRSGLNYGINSSSNRFESGDCSRIVGKSNDVNPCIDDDPSSTSTIESVLLLGLGAGDFLCYFAAYFPFARVDCVEINKVMVDICEKFRLINPSSTNIAVEDAFKFIEKMSSIKTQVYDIIYCDLYLTNPFPSEVFEDFFERTSKMVANKGVFMFNAYVPHTSKINVSSMFEAYSPDLYNTWAANVAHDNEIENVIFIFHRKSSPLSYRSSDAPTDFISECSKSKSNSETQTLLQRSEMMNHINYEDLAFIKEIWRAHAIDMQAKHNFRYPLPELLNSFEFVVNRDKWVSIFPLLN